MFSGQLTTPDRFSYHTGRAAADNLWAPPPTFVDRRAAADNLSARRPCLFCCVFIFFAIFDFRKRSSENIEDRMKFLGNLLKNIFGCRSRRPEADECVSLQ